MSENLPAKSSAKAIWITLAFVGLLAALLFFRMQMNPVQGPPGMGPGGKPGPQKVSAVLVQPVSLPLEDEFSGTLLAREEVQLTPEMSGRITRLNLREGQRVRKGECLLSLFDEDLKAQEEKLRLQESIAARTLDRARALLKSGSGTQQEADNAENQLNNIRADLRIVQANLMKTSLIAPFDGEVGFCNLSIGAWVNPGTPLGWLRDTRRLKLEFSVPEKYSSLFQKGQMVSFSGNQQTSEARIYALEPNLDAATRSLSIRAELANPDSKWLPGGFVKVKPDLQISAALMVPSQSIIPDNKGKKLVLFHNGKAAFREVETGIRTRNQVQIVSGIQAGDTVLTTGLMFVKPESELILTRIENKP